MQLHYKINIWQVYSLFYFALQISEMLNKIGEIMQMWNLNAS